MTVAARCRLLRGTTGGEVGATSVSRPVLLPEVRRVQRAARSCASSWSSHSAWGLYARGKVRRSHGWTDCGQKSCHGEHPVPAASCPNTCGLEPLTSSLSQVPGCWEDPSQSGRPFNQGQFHCAFRRSISSAAPPPLHNGRAS